MQGGLRRSRTLGLGDFGRKSHTLCDPRTSSPHGGGTLLARGPAHAMFTDVRSCLPSSRSQVICSSCQPGYYPKEKDGSKDCRICSVEDKGTQIALWCGVAVLSLLVFLLFLLWLGRRKGSDNIAQVKRLKAMQAEMKILVRIWEERRSWILKLKWDSEATSLRVLTFCCTLAWQLSLGQVLSLVGPTFRVSKDGGVLH